MSLYDSIVIEAHLPLAIRNICLCRRKYFTLKLLTLNRSGEAVPVFGLSLEIVVDMQSNLGKWLAEKPKSPKISNDEAFRDLFSNLVGYRKRNVFWECKFYSRSSWGNGHPQHWRQMIEGSALAWSVWHLRKQKKGYFSLEVMFDLHLWLWWPKPGILSKHADVFLTLTEWVLCLYLEAQHWHNITF